MRSATEMLLHHQTTVATSCAGGCIASLLHNACALKVSTFTMVMYCLFIYKNDAYSDLFIIYLFKYSALYLPTFPDQFVCCAGKDPTSCVGKLYDRRCILSHYKINLPSGLVLCMCCTLVCVYIRIRDVKLLGCYFPYNSDVVHL